MSEQTSEQRTLVPQLRFPEFRDAGEWQEEKLAKFLTESRIEGSAGDLAKKITVKLWGKGVFAKRESIKGSENTKYYKRRAGQFIYSKLDFINQAFGVVPEELDGFESTVDLPCFDIAEALDPVFLLEYVKREDFYRKNGEIADGGRKAKRIQTDVFLSFCIALPVHKAEQKKIADCLSSLDELLTAEGQKLDTLKAYKKGLMFQLFPGEGETVPCLRFKEFLNEGNWERVSLGDLGTLVSGLTYSPDDVRDDGLLVLRSSNIKDGRILLDDCVYVDPEIKGANLTKPDDILICVRNGSSALIGKNAIIPNGMPLCTHGAFMTVFRSEYAHFIFQLFQTPAYQNQVAADLGATINSINSGQLLKYKFFIPKPPEQMRIVNLLSSLDELVAAQSRKIDHLKKHRTALMQRLFPARDEVLV
ncbi:restriction endonuclease subunit S [Burkholderia anthina]|uniref:restriction endonuclease subunit S n=1 Tax=Burkholderia anthina TaxID=179879 RepID=UPI000F59F3F6|nr:restriction endonuclease subunit S [Burkholderia anthina]RQV71557.1 restriction endonuclease subunit S [Burkholderia anthina]